MKASCPRCGRGTEIDKEAGDFPVRCTKCGALLRRSSKRAESDEAEAPAAVRRIEHGTLAGLLIARSSHQESAPTIIRASRFGQAAVAALAADPSPSQHSILRPESRREIARAAARQHALRKAELRATLQSFGALGWAGLALIALLLVGAVALKAHAMWRHPDPLHTSAQHESP
ncbi:MAG TPA: hypothetical protein VHM90_03100 [Phycisphaerae bacterium]|jgi:hypothetical protein|nr:hypothetical protein [Phycisphaerae bacterium]